MRGALMPPGGGKWYALYYCTPDGPPIQVPFAGLEEIAAQLRTTAWGDHVFNPKVVYCWCRKNGVDCPQDVLGILAEAWYLHYDNVDDLVDLEYR